MVHRFSVWLVLALALFAAPAGAAERVALVIGNSSYRFASQLPNPQKDAVDVGEAFRRLGFEVVQANDLNFDDLRRALREMDRKALGADMAVIYYAGHGIEVDKVNYMIPVDAQLENDRSISYEAVPLDLALQAVAGAAKLKLVIVDACRDNPFLTTMERTDASRSLGRGLASVEPTAGTLVVYSAKEGTVALDGDSGTNSPFATALLSHIEQPGLEINFLFRKVRDDVLQATRQTQQPFTYGSLPAEQIFFVPPDSPPPQSTNSEMLEVAKLKQELADIKRLLEMRQNSGPANSLASDGQTASEASDEPAPEIASIAPAAIPPAPPRKSSPDAADGSRSTPDDPVSRAKAFLYSYNVNWSLPNSSALEAMRSLYADSVDYYGKQVGKEKIFAEKKKFADRWPDRIYAVRWFSIRTACESYCTLTAVVDWYARSVSRNAHSSGAASVKLFWDPDTEKIVAESSKVLETDRSSRSPSHIFQNWQAENDACRGGVAEQPNTLAACRRRAALGDKLAEFGWCYGRQGEAGYQHTWHRCDALSLR